MEALGPSPITATAAASYETPLRGEVREDPAFPRVLGRGHVRHGDENVAASRQVQIVAQ